MNWERIPREIKGLLILFLGVFILQKTVDLYFGGNLLHIFGFVPALAIFHLWVWQFFTFGFLHGDVMHLLLNALVVFFIGPDLYMTLGRRKFFSLYFFSAAVSGLLYGIILAVGFKSEMLALPMIGASASIFGLLVAFAMIFSDRSLQMFLVLPIPARQFIWILAGIELLNTLFSAQSSLSGLAHLGGMLGGVLYMFALRGAWIERVLGVFRFKKSRFKVLRGDGKGGRPKKPPPTWH